MNILIVHAHPENQSFTTSLKNLAYEVLNKKGYSVEISDLYEMNFNPVASKLDFQIVENPEYFNYALEQRNAVKKDSLSPDIKIEIDKVQRADLIIFTFPLYWTSVPAILKGWIDRVFVSGIFMEANAFITMVA